MPRRYNPRAARARAKALRAELAELRLIEARDARRQQRAVAARLRAVEGYARLREEHLSARVQAAIDEMELTILNQQRSEAGLKPLERLPMR